MEPTLKKIKFFLYISLLTLFISSCDYTIRDWNELRREGDTFNKAGDDESFSGKIEVKWTDSTGVITEIGVISNGYKTGIWKFSNSVGDTIMREIYGEYGKLERYETKDKDLLVYSYPYSSDGTLDKKEFYRNDSLITEVKYLRKNSAVSGYIYTYYDKQYQKHVDVNKETYAEGAFYDNQKQDVWKEGVRYRNYFIDNNSVSHTEISTLYFMVGEYKDNLKQGVWTLYNKGRQISEVFNDKPPVFAEVTYKNGEKNGSTKINLSLSDSRIDEALTINYDKNSISSFSFSDSLKSALSKFEYQSDKLEDVQDLIQLMETDSAPVNCSHLDLRLVDAYCYEATECTFEFKDEAGKTYKFDWELIPWLAEEGSYEKAFLQKYNQNYDRLFGYNFRVYFSNEFNKPGECVDSEEGGLFCTPMINMKRIQNQFSLDWIEFGCNDVSRCEGVSWYNQERYGRLSIGTKTEGLKNGLWLEFSPDGSFAIGQFSIERNRQNKKVSRKNWYWNIYHVNKDTEGGRFSEDAKSGNWYYLVALDGSSTSQYFYEGVNRTNSHKKTEAEARRNTRKNGTPSGGMFDAMNKISDPSYCSLCKGTGLEQSRTGTGSRRCPMCNGKGRRSY